jgi:hypothetical protein
MNAPFTVDLRSFLGIALLLAAGTSQAQAPLDGSLLGVTEQVLQATFSDLHKLNKPVLGPHGLRGLWSLANTRVAGLAFETTFYLKNKSVQRIEQRWTSTSTPCSPAPSFAALVSDLSLKYGTGLTSIDPLGAEATQRSDVWVAGDVDVLAHLTQAPGQCAILVIYKPHVVMDASTL